MATVLFALLFQSLHSYEHFIDDKIAAHQLDTQNQDVHVNDHNHQNCFVCEFTLNHFVNPTIAAFTFETSFEAISYHFFFNETPSFFSGSQYSLRGPPQVA